MGWEEEGGREGEGEREVEQNIAEELRCTVGGEWGG